MHKNEDIFVKQAQEFSPRLFYFALWHGGQTSDKGEKIPLFLIVLLFEKIYNYCKQLENKSKILIIKCLR